VQGGQTNHIVDLKANGSVISRDPYRTSSHLEMEPDRCRDFTADPSCVLLLIVIGSPELGANSFQASEQADAHL